MPNTLIVLFASLLLIAPSALCAPQDGSQPPPHQTPAPAAAPALAPAPALTQLRIGTGGVNGLFYPVGGVIQRTANPDLQTLGYQLSIQPTGGSIYNLNALAVGELDLALVQSDWLDQAYEAGGDTFPHANESLRSLMSLYTEALTIIARADSGISSIDDLPSKRVNIGAPGSGQRSFAEILMQTKGWSEITFAQAYNLSGAKQVTSLCEDRFDATIMTLVHPNNLVRDTAIDCDVRLISIPVEDIASMIAQRPYLAATTIPGNLYRGIVEDTSTLGIRAVLVTTDRLPEDVAQGIVKSLLRQFDRFKKRLSALSLMQRSATLTKALTPPLHDGARAYYQEAGLLAPTPLTDIPDESVITDEDTDE